MFEKNCKNTKTDNRSAVERVVETEIKVCTDRNGCSRKKNASKEDPSKEDSSKEDPLKEDPSQGASSPAARELAEEMYKNVTMGSDAYLYILPHVEDSRLKTDMTAALCYYEKLTGKIKEAAEEAGASLRESGMMAKMATRAGIAMNTVTDKTTSHIAEMLIEGCTMSVTTATKLKNHYEDKTDLCHLVKLCTDWAKFEEDHIERLKAYL